MVWRNFSKSGRVVLALFVGVAAGLVSARFLGAGFAPLVGWDAAALTLVAYSLILFRRATPEQTAAHATRDDAQHGVWDVVITLAAVASLGAVVLLLTTKGQGGSPFAVAVALASIVLSWATVHCIYAVHYAALYYSGTPGGIDFGQEGDPDFADFAYLAFTIGMTYQVSDTALTTKVIRHAALRHALLSFLFGTAIIATSINFVASLST